jgi:hypothetical protein
VIPAPRRHGENRREVHHHGPGDGHDVVLAGIVGGLPEPPAPAPAA